MGIVTRFYPNGEFTQGVDSMSAKQKRRHKKERKHEPLTQQCRDGYLEWVRSTPDSDSHLCVVGQQFQNQRGEIYTYYEETDSGSLMNWQDLDGNDHPVIMSEPIGRMVGRGELTPIGLSNARILTKGPSRKKCLTMTKHMARNIRNASYLLERQYGKDNLSFLTLTLPDLTPEDLTLCVTNWDKLVHKFLKWLRTKLHKQAIELSYVYCTEIQTKRLELRKEYAPHLHLLFRGRYGKKSAWAITPKMARAEWVRCLKSVCCGSFNTTALENLQRIKYTAAGYLSKYMSKTSNSLPCDDGGDTMVNQLLTHWGGMSRNLSRAIKAETLIVRQDGKYGDVATTFEARLEQLHEAGVLRYYKRGCIRLFYNGDDRDSRFLKVSVGCLKKPISAGGLEDMLQKLCELVLQSVTND